MNSLFCFLTSTKRIGNGRRIDLQLFADDKTEDPTPRRRQEARKKGQVARSQELAGSLVLVGAVLTLRYSLPAAALALQQQTTRLLTRWTSADWSVQTVMDVAWEVAGTFTSMLAPLLGVTVVIGVLANIGQTGFSFASRPLEERLKAFNPLENLKRMISRRSLLEFARGLLKLCGVGVVAYWTLRASITKALALTGQALPEAMGDAGQMSWGLLIRAALVLLVVALGDYVYQRWEFERSLRMSRDEVKRELRESEGDPQLKARRRSKQRELVRNQMLRAVADADVVVVNPTHFAVALGYKQEHDEAPVVLAKGRGYLALRIRSQADQQGIPVMEEPTVARALYRTAEVGQSIPPALYRAVAEILALVWRLRSRSVSRRAKEVGR